MSVTSKSPDGRQPILSDDIHSRDVSHDRQAYRATTTQWHGTLGHCGCHYSRCVCRERYNKKETLKPNGVNTVSQRSSRKPCQPDLHQGVTSPIKEPEFTPLNANIDKPAVSNSSFSSEHNFMFHKVSTMSMIIC